MEKVRNSLIIATVGVYILQHFRWKQKSVPNFQGMNSTQIECKSGIEITSMASSSSSLNDHNADLSFEIKSDDVWATKHWVNEWGNEEQHLWFIYINRSSNLPPFSFLEPTKARRHEFLSPLSHCESMKDHLKNTTSSKSKIKRRPSWSRHQRERSTGMYKTIEHASER